VKDGERCCNRKILQPAAVRLRFAAVCRTAATEIGRGIAVENAAPAGKFSGAGGLAAFAAVPGWSNLRI
tara:strand:- start:503 stop:709 length:207 start_codon:yes stop_codon:yes gene_type:complete